MHSASLRLVSLGSAPLAGTATSLARAALAGYVVAGDDRGEVGVWNADGSPVMGWSMPAAVVCVDATPDGSQIAALDKTGRLRVVGGSGKVLFDQALPDGDLIRIAPAGDCYHVVTAECRRVDVLNAHGRPIREFEIPAGIVGYVVDPRDGAAVMIDRDGLMLRMTGWGSQVWAHEIHGSPAALSMDAEGTLFSVALHRRGAENFRPKDGARFGGFDEGVQVRCVSLGQKHALLGSRDGTLALIRRNGEESHGLELNGTPIQCVVADDGASGAVRLGQGGIVFVRLVDSNAPSPTAARVQTPDGPRLVWHRACAPRMHSGGAKLVSIRPDGLAVAALRDPHTVVVHDVAGDVVEEHTFEGNPLALRLYSDGTGLLVTSRQIVPLAAGPDAAVSSVALEPLEAHLPAGQHFYALLEEFGGIRVNDRRTGEEAFHSPSDPDDPPRSVRCFGTTVVAQHTGGRFRLHSPIGSSPFQVDGPPGVQAQLAGALPTGCVIVAGASVRLHGWNGEELWSRSLPGFVNRTLTGRRGTLFVGGAFGVAVFDAEGQALLRPTRTKGRVAGLLERGTDPIIVLVDGRRVVLVRTSGRPLWHHTFEDEVAALDASGAGGSVAALLGSRVALVTKTVTADETSRPSS
jgi:hypothetical protein